MATKYQGDPELVLQSRQDPRVANAAAQDLSEVCYPTFLQIKQVLQMEQLGSIVTAGYGGCVVATDLAIGHRLAENAKRGADQLRPLVEHLPTYNRTIVIEVNGVRFEVSGTVMRGVVDVLDAVVTNTSAPSEDVSEDELTPQQAAGVLRMSRPSVMRLVEKGLLSARLVGSHHRLVRSEVLSYKDRNSAVRREALQNLADMTEEHKF